MTPREPLLGLDHRFTHVVTVADSVILVGDDDSLLLDTPVAADVTRLLDARHTAVDIAESLREHHPRELVHFLLLKWEHEGVVHRVEEDVGEGEGGASESLAGTSGSSALASAMRRAWHLRGTRPVARVTLDGVGDGGDLLLTDDYLRPELAEFASEPLAPDSPRLLARLGRRQVWLGPWIVPRRTACVACLQERLRINLVARSLLHLSQHAATAGLDVRSLDRAVPLAAFSRLAEAAVAEAGPGEPATLRVLSLDGGQEQTHSVSRLPDCPRCGDPTLSPPGADIHLRPRPREGGSGSGYRTVTPQETLRLLAPLVSPLTGVVRYVRKVPVEGVEDAYVYTANHAHCLGAASLRTLRADRRDHSGGKGLVDLDARVSALCESVERFSSLYRGSEPVRLACRSELGAAAVSPNEILLFSEGQYRTRDAWNAADASGFQWVPEPYADDVIEWSRVRSLVSGEDRWVPSGVVYLGFTGEGRCFCKGDSNGLASGNCLEEAILQGFLELVERDGIALWWYNRARRPGVDLESFADPRIRDTQRLYPGLHRDLWALDLTSDLGIPTFVALSARTDGPPEDIVFGFGAHLDPEIALMRALSEVNQMLPTILQSPEERRRQLLPDFADAIEWWEAATLTDHPYLQPNPGRPTRRSDFHVHRSGDLFEDVRTCVERASAAGCDVLVHDLTRPSIGFPVARVLVPGLRHFWRRLGPGRLYQVPVRLGWMEGALEESEMNPVSMFV